MKAIDKVYAAWVVGKPARYGNISTNGKTIFSYAMPICARICNKVVVVKKEFSPSMTTTKHINSISNSLRLDNIKNELIDLKMLEGLYS